MRLLGKRHFYELEAAGRYFLQGLSDRLCVAANYRPDVGAKDDKGQISTSQILLVLDILIGSHEHIKPCRFRSRDQLPVFDLRRPSHFNNRMDFVFRKKRPYTNGNVVIKQDAQSGTRSRIPKLL